VGSHILRFRIPCQGTWSAWAPCYGFTPTRTRAWCG
jgi:hypothetical protein